MDDYLIETRELTQQFGAKLAVDHLDPLVPAAGVYGFLGSNSAGKTTAGVGFSPQPKIKLRDGQYRFAVASGESRG